MAEHNLIQAPETIGRLAKTLGIRQAHITPTLNEGIQAVVIVDDVRESTTGRIEHFSTVEQATSGSAEPPAFSLTNPDSYTHDVRITRLIVGCDSQAWQQLFWKVLTGSVGPPAFTFASSVFGQNTNPRGRTSGLALVGGTAISGLFMTGPMGRMTMVPNANPLFVDFHDLYVPPGCSFRFMNDDPSATLTLWVEWDEMESASPRRIPT